MSTKKRPGGHPARAGEAEDAREARKAKAAALRQRELARERRRRVVLISIAVVVVLALVAVVAVVINRSRDSAAGGQGTPPGVTADNGGYVLAGTPAEGAPTVDIWVDYQCPICKQFEDVSGTVYPQLAADGKAKVVVHTLTFLDDNLGNDASERAAEGAAAAADQGKFIEYTQQVYANQPEQEGTGYTDDQLQQFAEAAGVADLTKWRQQLDDHTWVGFVRRVEAAMSDQGVNGTPTVIITSADGTKKNISQTTSNGGDGSISQLLGANGAQFLTDQVAAATAAPATTPAPADTASATP